MNNFKYDFDRVGGKSSQGRRMRFILIFAAVLAVTGGIVYYLIPHHAPDAAKRENANNASPTSAGEVERAKPTAEANSNPAAAAEDMETAPVPPAATAKSTDGEAETGDNTSPTAEPEKGKAWIGDPRETPKPPSPTADVELDATGKTLKPLQSGDAASIAEFITVAPGDSLSRIAARCHTTVEALRHYNKLKNDVIRIGRKLAVIPGPWRITVDKSRRELILERARGGVWNTFGRFQVGLGRLDRTPEAEFVISTRLRHPDWYAPDGRIFRYGDAGNQLGDYFLKLAAAGTPNRPLRGFGIHGTSDDTTVGKNWSNGCVRMHNREVELLYYLVPSGTPVRIVSGANGADKAEKSDE